MAANKRLLVGVVLSIVAGSALATVAANLDRATEPPVVAVPPGRFGDVVTYARYIRGEPEPVVGGDASWFSRPLPGPDAELHAAQVFTLEGPLTALDREGAPHSVLRVRWDDSPRGNPTNFYSSYEEPPGTRAPRPQSGGQNATTSTVTASAAAERKPYYAPRVGPAMAPQVGEDLLLDERIAVRSEHVVSRGERTSVPVPGTSGRTISSSEERTRASDFDPRAPQTFFLRHQGRTLHLGDEIVPPTPLRHFQHWVVGPSQRVPLSSPSNPQPYDVWHDGYVFPDVESIDFHEWVADQARVNGRDALGVRTEVTIRFRQPAMNGAEPGPWLTLSVRLRAWMVEGSPYPVLIESDHYAHSLAGVRTGTTPIPWGDPDAATAGLPLDGLGPFEEAGDLERSPPGQRHPSDGREVSWSYRLDTAVQDALVHPGLAGLHSWWIAHPTSALVGAHYTVNASQPLPYAWNLLYATPEGAGHEVVLRRDVASPLAEALDAGDRAVPRFSIQDLPEAPLTLASAARLWRLMAAPDAPAAEINSIQWGFSAWKDSARFDTTRCTATLTPTPQWNEPAWNPFETRRPLAEARLGFHELLPCAGDRPREEAFLLTTDVETGQIVDYAAQKKEHDVHLAGAYESRTPPTLASVAPGMRPPTITVATLASGSFLLAFVLVYLAPALKYAATQGAVVLPGYSKLKRSELLDNRVRDRLVAAIREDPGVDATELQRRTQAAWGTVVYHLTVLERNHLVSSLLDGGHRRFFPVGEVDWSRRGQIALLRNDRARQLYEAIAHEPGINQEALAHRMGMSSPGVLWHLGRLEGAGLVGRVKQGRKVHYYANAAGYPQPPYNAGEAVEVS